jgi:hypothetical protein
VGGTILQVKVLQDPSDGFRRLPWRETAEFDVRISFDAPDRDRIRARMSGPAVHTLKDGEIKADLWARLKEVQTAGAGLVEKWRTAFVEFQPTEAGRPAPGRRFPYASLVDLSSEPEAELREVLDELALAGAHLLFGTLLKGEDPYTEFFREQVAEVLARDGLRVRFDSAELFLPWPMLCLRPADLPGTAGPGAALNDVFARFLGFRHQIEHAGDPFPRVPTQSEPPRHPAVSINHDTAVGASIDSVKQVADTLKTRPRCAERTTYRDLVRDLGAAEMDEQLMYFWCHGQFRQNGAEPAQLVIRLTDDKPLDGQTVDALRDQHKRTGVFEPFVILNACHGGAAAADADRAFLGRILIRHGAQGVLGPQIEMPQAFAARYALDFVTEYLRGGREDTAGAVAHRLTREFASKYRNPLGLAYALHSGMDSRIRSADGSGDA